MTVYRDHDQELKMKKPSSHKLSRRERQIMDILYRNGDSTAAQVRDALSDPPSYSAVRAFLRILEEKGWVKHAAQGKRYLFSPAKDREKEKKSALRHIVDTFFDGSARSAVASLMDISDAKLSDEEYESMRALIKKARRKKP
jgi:BlaI family penicillinase repressor